MLSKFALQNERTIDFLGIGGHACGSTKLYHLMKAHPEIGFVHKSREKGIDIRGKECHYWDRYSDRSLGWYLSYFKWEYPCVGEITPAYARLNEDVVKRIALLFPDIHVFFIIRDTAERTWSNIRKNIVKQGIRNPTVQWMINQAKDEKTLSRNDYLRTVRQWGNAFHERLHVIRFDRFVGNPLPVMLRIADWLSVDAEFYRTLDPHTLNMQINMTPALPMPDELSAWLRDHNPFDWESQLFEIEKITTVI